MAVGRYLDKHGRTLIRRNGTIPIGEPGQGCCNCGEGGDPCTGTPDETCENLLLSYSLTTKTFYVESGDPDPCNHEPNSTTGPTPIEIELIKFQTGGGGIATSCICSSTWEDVNNEHALDLCCPGGWTLGISFPANLTCCSTVKAGGLNPYGDYPNMTCCAGPFPDESSPTGFIAFEYTHSDTIIACNDAP